MSFLPLKKTDLIGFPYLLANLTVCMVPLCSGQTLPIALKVYGNKGSFFLIVIISIMNVFFVFPIAKVFVSYNKGSRKEKNQRMRE